jgi:hypothetical protein
MAVAVLMRIVLLASFALVAAVSAMVVAVVIVAGSVYELVSGAVSSVSPAVVVTLLEWLFLHVEWMCLMLSLQHLWLLYSHSS